MRRISSSSESTKRAAGSMRRTSASVEHKPSKIKEPGTSKVTSNIPIVDRTEKPTAIKTEVSKFSTQTGTMVSRLETTNAVQFIKKTRELSAITKDSIISNPPDYVDVLKIMSDSVGDYEDSLGENQDLLIPHEFSTTSV